METIQKLRELTGAGIMDCKRALADAGGNLDAAAKLIAERGLVKAAKKGERATGAGLLESYIHNGRVGVLLELRCETDFVAHADPMKFLAKELTFQIAAMDPTDVPTLLAQPYVRDEKQTVDQLVKNTIARVGENIRVEQFARYEI